MRNSFVHRMLSGGGNALVILLALLVSLGAVACRNDVPAEGRGSLNIIVNDQASKTIAYEPSTGYPAAMSHYTVVVKDSGGASVGTSDYMELENGSGRFEVTDLVTGTYTVDVSGYIKTGESAYTLIATGTEKATVGASYANNLVVAIDTFDDAYTGDMTVSLMMPIDAVVDGTITGDLSWTLVSVDDSGVSFTGSETLTAAALDDGKHTLTIADRNVPGGRYLLTVTFDNGSDYSGIDAVIAYPGLPSTGTINLDSRKPSTYEFTVTDKIGNALSVSADGEYSTDEDSFNISFRDSLASTEKVIFLVDGVVVDSEEAKAGVYMIGALDEGRRHVVAIVYDTELKSAVGSASFVVNIETECGVEVITNAVGVAWDYGDPDPQLYRLYTDEAAAAAAEEAGMKAMVDPHGLVWYDIIEEPVSSYEGKPGSSPFDELGPWKDMKLYALNDGGPVKDVIGDGETIRQFVDDNDADNMDFMVYLPEAWLRVIDDPENEIRYYYVSDTEFEGSSLQPASGHYIGRYSAMDPDITGEQSHRNNADEVYSRPSYKATGTQKVATYLSMQNAYDVTHKRNDGVTTVDSRTYGGLLWEEVSYVQLMYLVEYANLNSQTTLGYGSGAYTSGDSDDMPYHTGVIGTKTKENSHVQYRYVEGLLGRDNSCNIVENLLVDDYVMYIAPDEESLAVAAKSGIFNKSGSGTAPSDWVAIGTMPSSGWITGMNYDETLPWSIGVASEIDGGSDSTYATDYVNTTTGLCSVRLSFNPGKNNGAWRLYVLSRPSDTYVDWSARLSFR